MELNILPNICAQFLRQHRLTLIASVCALGLAGCAWQSAPPAVLQPVVVVPTAPALSDAARMHLAEAEARVVDARKAMSLWTSALDALARARVAAEAQDSDSTIEYAKRVIALCERSIEQTKSPLVTW
jgi:hypothetical protein